jgi:hypothetical protein
MDLNALLCAPEGLSEPITALYNAVAQALSTAIWMHREKRPAAHSWAEFRSQAQTVALAMADAERAKAMAELPLHGKAADVLKVCHDALSQVEFVEHACHHILGELFEDRPGTACRPSWPCESWRGVDTQAYFALPCQSWRGGDIRAYFALWPALDERAVLEAFRQHFVAALLREWSRDRTLREWAKVFGYTPRRMGEVFRSQEIANRMINRQRFKVDINSIDPAEREKHRQLPQRDIKDRRRQVG